MQFYLHLNPGSGPSRSLCLRSPGALTCAIIDAKIIVLLHLQPEWLTSFVICPGCPYWSAACVDNKITVFLHVQDKPSIAALKHLTISDHITRYQIRSIHGRRLSKT